MAPSARSAKYSRVHKQTDTKILNLGRVTKSKLNVSKDSFTTKSQAAACEQLLAEKDVPVQLKRVETRPKMSKRKRDEVESDEECEDSTIQGSRVIVSAKKPKFQLPTPPSSRNNTDNEESSPEKSAFSARRTAKDLPEVLQRLISLHAAFLKAFSLHFAHNGVSTPAELNSLTFSVTRIWKKSAVTQLDLQRVLALYEVIDISTANQEFLNQNLSPFRISTAGLGSNIRTNVEFCGGITGKVFRERELQTQYENQMLSIFEMCKTDSQSFVYGLENAGPLLSIVIGNQTQSHRQKASLVRTEILSKPGRRVESSGPDLSKLSISDQTLDQTPISVKSRTLSLFDRVRAKGITNASNITPTSEQLTRRHAIGKIPEIVEFLRMKQLQKLSASASYLDLDDLEAESYGSSSRTTAKPSSRISFSLGQIVKEVRESAPIPVSAEEVQVVLRILAHELPELAGWVQIIEVGSVASVTLNGTVANISGKEIARLIQSRK